jgi:hypothetical protein
MSAVMAFSISRAWSRSRVALIGFESGWIL